MARISKGQLEKLQKKYKTDEAIGTLYGISRQAVHQLRDKYGIAPVSDKHRERNEEVRRLYGQGTSGIKCAKKTRLSISQTYRIINLPKSKKGKRH
jgi:DNA invertase Pin-like site-specific DNA recombinase